MGFATDRQYWNRGCCTEALKQLVAFAFELKLHKLISDNDSDNPASGRVFEKVDFKQEGVFKEQVVIRGQYIDVIHWGLLNPADQ
ncbi:MAG: GNAT family protein [Caldilineaceae bacterium]